MNIKSKLYGFFNNNGLEFIMGLLVVIIYFVVQLLINKQSDFLKIGNTILNFFITIVISMLAAMICGYFRRLILRNLEDKTRLTTKYKLLLDRYYNLDDKLVKYCSFGKKNNNYKYLDDGKVLLFPVINDADLIDKTIHFQYDGSSEYQLPDVVLEYQNELLSAYHMTRWDNSKLFRVKDWGIEGDIFEVKLEITNYFNTLLTNRAMDFSFNNNTTIRDWIGYSPYFPELKDSALSNYLGINGFVISMDNYVSFVHRSSSTTVGKNTLGNGISAKVNYKKIMKIGGNLYNAFFESIGDELKKELEIDIIDTSKIKIINAFRNVVEGGKPHFLFVYNSSIKIKCEPHCNKPCKEEHEKGKKNIGNGRVICKNKNIRDGKKIEWIKVELLEKAIITPDMMICDEKNIHLNHQPRHV